MLDVPTIDQLSALRKGLRKRKAPIVRAGMRESFESFGSFSVTKAANEFIPEIIERSEDWEFGNLIDLSESKLIGLIEHPHRFITENERIRLNWSIFPVTEKIRQYLQLLPGSKEYQLAIDELEKGDYETYQIHLKIAAVLGHGQAMYALQDESDKKNLIKLAENGSPDAFIDLIYSLYDYAFDFKNTAMLNPTQDVDFLTRIDCMIYLYTLMERLGIQNYESTSIETLHLSLETDSGYCWSKTSIEELKYKLCDHKHIVKINDRASKWNLGHKFDVEFMSKINLMKIID